MTTRDSLGHALTGATPEGLAAYDEALRLFQRYAGDPVAAIERALAPNPGFVMAHVFKAYLNLLGTEPLALPAAEACLRAAQALPQNDRERGHLAAIAHLVEGRWHAAARVLEDVAIAYPRDALALQAGHQIDFFTGRSRMLRDRIARALPAWNENMPGFHSLLGMHAFGLEETADYTAAEAQGRRALEIEPRDTWAKHAVTHVMEMEGRQRDGIAWMRQDSDNWSKDSFFAVHNWWHLALFHLDLGEIEEVLKLFDGPIYGPRSKIVLEMIDASAMLWRLHLRGIDVGERWKSLADDWAPIATAGNYAFNDAHAMMAFVGAGRKDLAEAVIESMKKAMCGKADNASFTREVGYPVTNAIKEFGAGRYAETVALLRPVRDIAARFGGSHAQRDLLDLTLIEAAFRSGQGALARALAAERQEMKPTSPLARAFLRRAAPLVEAA